MSEDGRGGSGYGIWLGWSWSGSGIYGERLLAEYCRGRRLGHFGKKRVKK